MKLFGWRPGLLARIAVALAAVGLLPVAVASFGLKDLNRQALEDQVLATHAVAAHTAAERAEAFLATRTALVQGAAADPALAQPRSPAAQEALRSDLAAWSGLGVLALAVVDDQGVEAIRAQLRDEAAKQRAAAALRLPGGAPLRTLRSARGELAAVRIEVPLAGGGGRLRLVADAAPLADAVSASELGEEAELVLADRGGDVLIGAPGALDAFPRPLVKQALSGRLAGANRYAGADGRRILGAFAPVAGSGWAVLSRQPALVAEAVALRTEQRSRMAVGAALLLILLLSAVAWAALVRPIRELAQAQGALAGVAPEEAARGGDEIGALRRTFEALQRSLAERQSLAGISLGRYRVVELLGTGAMGTVFRGWDPRLQRPVALKTVRLGVHLDAERRRTLLDSLLHEAVTIARLNHPNVVAVYDIEDAPEGAFIAMEFVEGTSLEDLLWQRGRLQPDEVVPLGAAIARGLAAAHARDIVHRDVKPGNVLLGRDGTIKVSDFGIADLVAGAAQPGGRVYGTPGYLPPESLLGGGHGKPGDLFALGVVLYEGLTGTRPFVGANVAEVVRATLLDAVRPLDRQAADIPPALTALVLRLLVRDPAERPAGAAEVADELDRMAAERRLRWALREESPSASGAPAEREIVLSQWVPTVRMTETPAPVPTAPAGTNVRTRPASPPHNL